MVPQVIDAGRDPCRCVDWVGARATSLVGLLCLFDGVLPWRYSSNESELLFFGLDPD